MTHLTGACQIWLDETFNLYKFQDFLGNFTVQTGWRSLSLQSLLLAQKEIDLDTFALGGDQLQPLATSRYSNGGNPPIKCSQLTPPMNSKTEQKDIGDLGMRD